MNKYNVTAATIAVAESTRPTMIYEHADAEPSQASCAAPLCDPPCRHGGMCKGGNLVSTTDI